MQTRSEHDFWAVWKSGLEWPMLFASETMAKEKAHLLAKDAVGQTVHLMKIQSIGTAEYPATPRLTGNLAG